MDQEPTTLPEAAMILLEEIEQTRRALHNFNIPLYVEEQSSTGIKPFFTTCYDHQTLRNINVEVNLHAIMDKNQLFTPPEFRNWIHSGLREETIHSLQILSTIYKFNNLDPVLKSQWENPEDFYQHQQTTLFNELAATPKGQEILLAAGRLYYAKPDFQTVEELRDFDISRYNRPGYITVELTRQIIQARIGETLSEEGKGKCWDPLGRMENHAEVAKSLVETIRSVATHPETISPLLKEIIDQVEENISRLNILHKFKAAPPKAPEPELEPS